MKNTIVECDCLPIVTPSGVPSLKSTSSITQLLSDLNSTREQNALLKENFLALKVELQGFRNEVTRLKDQMLRWQQDNNARIDRLLQLLNKPPSSVVPS